jgi:putative ATP-binding cassette transporter
VRESDGALVSIAHRPAVAAFHDRQWTFTPNDGGGDGARYRLVPSAT